jgi:hypothetical protein
MITLERVLDFLEEHGHERISSSKLSMGSMTLTTVDDRRKDGANQFIVQRMATFPTGGSTSGLVESNINELYEKCGAMAEKCVVYEKGGAKVAYQLNSETHEMMLVWVESAAPGAGYAICRDSMTKLQEDGYTELFWMANTANRPLFDLAAKFDAEIVGSIFMY